jgi:hypothetical protein
MGRKIVMTGKNAQYVEHRGVNVTPDNDREIRMEGDEAVYQEYAYGQAAQPRQEDKPTEEAVKQYPKDAARNLLMDNAEYVEPIVIPEYAEVVEEVKATDDADKAEQDPVSEQANVHLHGNESSLSDSRQAILNQLLDLADKGDWIKDNIGEQVKAMLKTVLGQGDTLLKDNEAELSKKLWKLLENGRGDRVAIVWQNIVGYLDEKGLFYLKGSPALNKDFFGNEKNYSNIDKGRPRNQDNGMSSGFREILPLLDTYVPRVDKKA